jgi:hypothetical protein
MGIFVFTALLAGGALLIALAVLATIASIVEILPPRAADSRDESARNRSGAIDTGSAPGTKPEVSNRSQSTA